MKALAIIIWKHDGVGYNWRLTKPIEFDLILQFRKPKPNEITYPRVFVLSVRGQVKVYFSNDSQNVNRQRLRMVSFTFKGAEAGWVTAQRHTNECVPRVFTLLSTHTMWPFIALSCASVAPASAVSTRWRGRPRLEEAVPPDYLCDLEWVLKLLWPQLLHW